MTKKRIEDEEVISLEHFRAIFFAIGLNSEAFDVELYYKKYVALVSGTEKDYEMAENNLIINQQMGMLGRLN